MKIEYSYENSRNRRIGAVRSEDPRKTAVYNELEKYRKNGVPLWLNGRESTSEQIAHCVCEHSDYMRDYYTDDRNRICGISFDRIRWKNDRQRNSLMRKLK